MGSTTSNGERSSGRGPRTVVIGPGLRAPYPEPSSAAATKIALANRRKDTKCEVELRSVLHRIGLRFRKDHLIRVGAVRVRPDIVFTRARVAVFVDGCFWHLCPLHAHVPKSNVEYWVSKLEANVARDRRDDATLQGDGWHAERVWEHESPLEAGGAIARIVRARLSALRCG